MTDPTLPREGDPVLAGLDEDDVMYDHPVSASGEPMDPVLFVRWAAIEAAIRSRPVEEGWTDQRIAEVFGGWFEDGMWQGAEWSIQGIVEEMGPVLRAARPVEVDPERRLERARDLVANYLWNEDDSGNENDLADAYDLMRDVLGPSTDESLALTFSSPEPRKP